MPEFDPELLGGPIFGSFMLSECAFMLQYVVREAEEEDRFQIELKEFFNSVLQDKNPFIFQRLENWTLGLAIGLFSMRYQRELLEQCI